MYSMTGYGKGVYCEGGLELTVEVKSVNNRYLDLAIKSPRIFLSCEDLTRSMVRGSISRGHVDVFVSYSDKREKERTFTVDINLVRAYVAAANELKGAFSELENDVTIAYLLRQQDVVKQEDAAGDDEALVEAFKAALAVALENHKAMRLAEGERLKADLLSRMDKIAELREKIAKRAPMVAEEYRERLSQRIAEYLSGKVEETRILTEAAVFADKCNIDEELTRLASHIVEFRAISASEQVGRKLDFLVQEFNRECNTICSKSNDAEITTFGLEMKNEIEKVREQIQNLE